jgi:hypothetical protein
MFASRTAAPCARQQAGVQACQHGAPRSASKPSQAYGSKLTSSRQPCFIRKLSRSLHREHKAGSYLMVNSSGYGSQATSSGAEEEEGAACRARRLAARRLASC